MIKMIKRIGIAFIAIALIPFAHAHAATTSYVKTMDQTYTLSNQTTIAGICPPGFVYPMDGSFKFLSPKKVTVADRYVYPHVVAAIVSPTILNQVITAQWNCELSQ